MRTSMIIFFFMLSFTVTSNAQELGLRFGDVTGGNVALDAVFATGDFNRIHADVSFGDGVGVDLIWDFVYKPLGDESLYWYFGVGPYAFLGDPFQLGAVSELGIEYRFADIPLVIGADWRPTFRLVDDTDLFFDRFGLNVRWNFNE